MSKIYYSDNSSLSNQTNSYLYDSFSCVKNTLNYCNYLIPSDFAYVSFLRSLPSTLSDYLRRLNQLSSSLGEIDRGYQSTFESMESALAGLDVSVIDEKLRLIK